jgi:CRP-like cAMP-binding protein
MHTIKELPSGGFPPSSLEQNHLLSALSHDVLEHLRPYFRLVKLPLGKCLYESGDILKYVYFPTNSIISLVYVMNNGDSAEISIVGNDGLLGTPLFMGGGSTSNRAVVQSEGYAYQISGQILQSEFSLRGHLHDLLLRYTQSLMTQMAQTAVCNRHHSIEQQLCRWLLLSLDRIPTNVLTMTQELIADMLGVRREGVSVAASRIQQKGAIEYHRGRITIVDRELLEELSCECYDVVKQECERILHYLPPNYFKN